MSFEKKIPEVMPLATAAVTDPVCCQIAGLCWRQSGKEVEVLLITSRDTGRWVLPKGWPIKGLSGPQSALREAYEEAGVEGVATNRPIGAYPYVKTVDAQNGFPCEVTVFPIEVKHLASRFPEASQRQRKWFPLAKAAKKVDEAELSALIRGFDPDRIAATRD